AARSVSFFLQPPASASAKMVNSVQVLGMLCLLCRSKLQCECPTRLSLSAFGDTAPIAWTAGIAMPRQSRHVAVRQSAAHRANSRGDDIRDRRDAAAATRAWHRARRRVLTLHTPL